MVPVDPGPIDPALLPPPFSWGALWTEWNLGPAALVPVVVAGAAYLAGVRRLRRTGVAWRTGRTAAFLSGLVAVLLALASPIDAYAEVRFSVHMAQHVLLMLVAPPLLALGAPITLGLRGASPWARRRLWQPLIRSRAATWLSNPVVGWVLFAAGPFALHFSPIYQASMGSAWIHALEHALFLGIGLVYWWPLVGADPSPHRVSYPVRIFSLLLAIPAGGFLSLALFSETSPLYAWYAALPAPWSGTVPDQRTAAALMWVVGGAILVVAVLFEAAAWRRAEEARQRRAEDGADRRGDGDRADGAPTVGTAS
jgi:putative copper resistance protein D